MMMIGQTAPNFNSIAIMPDGALDKEFDFQSYVEGKMNVLFFFSMAFSYICPTELLALNAATAAFRQREVMVTAISCDSHMSMQQWVDQSMEQGGLDGRVNFPIVSDQSRKIAQNYGVLVNGTLPARATFIIDSLRVVRSQMLNDFHMGRNIAEIVRLIDAHQHHEQTGQLCPANWERNQPSLTGERDQYADYMSKHGARLKRSA